MKRKVFAIIMCAAVLAGTSGCFRQLVEESPSTAEGTEEPSEAVSSTADPAEQTSAGGKDDASGLLVDDGSEYPPETEAFVEFSDYLPGFATFEVTSEDLVDGRWADNISNTHIGENESPELKWEPVEGAGQYVIYMVDRNSNGYLHWKSEGITETELPHGWAHKLTEYNGPHIGHGYTHTFDVYVIALKAPVERLKGALNAVNPRMQEFFLELDTDSEGNTGNIIAYGKVSGLYTDARFRNGKVSTEPYYM